MIIPTGTDAPLYHYPISTVALIVVNVTLFCLGLGAHFDPNHHILAFGDGLHPTQWVSSFFLHANVGHLIGNMVFLLLFGLIVEGKIGWWKFLGLYMFIGTMKSIIAQIVMLGADGGGALGASAAIMGLVATAMVWAPVNEIHFIAIMRSFAQLGHASWEFSANILTVGFFYVGLDFVMLTWGKFAMGSAWGHCAGAAIGFVVALAFVCLRWVDCEGYDLVSHYIGPEWLERSSSNSSPTTTTPVTRANSVLKAERLQAARQQVTVFIQHQNTMAAIKLFNKIVAESPDTYWTEEELLALIGQLRRKNMHEECVPYLEEYLQRFGTKAHEVRLVLAEYYVYVSQPTKALETLRPISQVQLPASLHQRREVIFRNARALA